MNAPARQVLLVLMLVLGVVGCNGDVVFMGADAMVTPPPPSDAGDGSSPSDGAKEGGSPSDATDAAVAEVAEDVAPPEPDAAPADDGGGQ